MTSEVELRKWLNRPNKDFPTNLQFAIKAWNSIEFSLITKHEIITEEFCQQLPKFRKYHKHKLDQYFDVWQTTINEFLALTCSPGSINSTVKSALINTLKSEAKKHKSNPHPTVLKGMLLVLHNIVMQTYYKSNCDVYCEFIAAILKYINALTSANPTIAIKDEISQILDDIKIFIRQTPHLNLFQLAFLQNILRPLSELVIKLQVQKSVDFTERLLEILKQLYLADQTNNGVKSWFTNKTDNQESIFTQLFAVEIHTFLLIVEAIFQIYRYDVGFLPVFIRWLFDKYFRSDNAKFSDRKEMLDSMSYVMHLMRKHDVRLTFNIDNEKVIVFIGKHLEGLFDEMYKNALDEMINLIIATLTANPMILESVLLPIVVKCMLIPKRSASTMKRYTQMMQLVIDIYRRLSRAPKFISQLIRSIYDQLSVIKLSRQLKRKPLDSSTSGESLLKKLKINGQENGHDHTNGNNEDEEIQKTYLKMLLQNYETESKLDDDEQTTAIECMGIEFAWPSAVGNSFSKFISNLISKPSLVVCKTLTFTLADYVNLLKTGQNDENTIFLIEFASALLSQYYIGTRLAEHADQQMELIEESRNRTHDVLKEFGMAILNQEHNIRTMNAFLKICFHASNFDLLCWYYCPDTIKTTNSDRSGGDIIERAKLADNIHPYLRAQEWTLIEQRITNFGRDECKANINRLYLQRIKAALLLGKVKKHTISNHLISSTFSDLTQIKLLLSDNTNIGQWFVETLTITEMRCICDLLLSSLVGRTSNCLSMKILNYFCDNRVALEIFILTALKKCCELTGIIETKVNVEAKDIHKVLFREIINRIRDENSLCSSKQLTNDEIHLISVILQILKQLPIGFVDVDVKNVLFMMSSAIYLDKKMTGKEYSRISQQSVELIKELINFGDLPTIFNDKHFTIYDLQSIFVINDIEIYHLLFGRIVKNLDKSNTKMLTNYLNDFENHSNDDEITSRVCIILLNYLSKERKCRELYSKCREVVLNFIKMYFENHKTDDTDATKKFIQLTLSGFTTIISSILTTRTSSNAEPLDGDLIEIFHWFFSRLIHLDNIAAIKLLSIAINFKELLKTTAEQIDLVIKHYWQRYIIDTTIDNIIDERIELYLKILLTYTSNDETFALFSKIIDARNADGSFKSNTFQHLATIAKLQLSKAKGQMFVESFKKYFSQINLHKQLDPTLSHEYDVKLLQCQRVIVENSQLPVSMQFIDDAIALISEINLKKIQITSSTSAECIRFVSLHQYAADLCYSLIQYRSIFIVDRVPQFCAIFKDLLQSICLYRNNRAPDENLSNSEITMLAEQSHKLENIVKSLIKHAKDVKRVAPYLLIFVLNLYTSNERPTTLYPKIKTYIDNICYDLISICDHRANGFIMRCCNESSKELYEKFVKEYNKYHKFRGKV